jgi:hypothetical protein
MRIRIWIWLFGRTEEKPLCRCPIAGGCWYEHNNIEPGYVRCIFMEARP